MSRRPRVDYLDLPRRRHYTAGVVLALYAMGFLAGSIFGAWLW